MGLPEDIDNLLGQLNDPALKYRGYDCDWKSRLRLKPFKKCGLEVLFKT